MTEKHAGIIVIGNEVLSGKVEDINSTWLVSELRDLGRMIDRVVIIPDDVDVIAEQVRSMAAAFDPVLTTGGVGPTHDDKTFEGVARAFGRSLVHVDAMEDVLRRHYKERFLPAHLRMARLPEGRIFIWSENLLFPVTRFDNVWIFPGDPMVLRRKFGAIRETFRDAPIAHRRIYTGLEEGEIADLLAAVEARYPGLQVGSYPAYDDRDYLVLITLESRDADTVERALAELLAALPADAIRRIE